MNIEFIGINDKIINLSSVAMIEDAGDEKGSIAKITFTDGLEIEVTGSDADLLLDRCELIMRATDQFLANLQAAGEED